MNFRSLLELDARLSDQLRVAEKPGLLRTIAAFLAHSGDSWFWALALIIVWFFSNSFWKEWETVAFMGLGGLAAVVLAVKFIVKRERPQGDWGGIYRSTDPHSFPSGHAARAFLFAVVATALAPGWLAVILWIWAPLVKACTPGLSAGTDSVSGRSRNLISLSQGLNPAMFFKAGK
jgi:undecaprenyl-diphosphatase